MRYKGIIFDLDGVICFTDKYHYLAWKEMADSTGIYFDETINNRLRGVSRMESLDIILERSDKIYSQDDKEKLAEQKNELYKTFLLKMTPADLSDEVKNTLDELRKRGHKLAIGSSSKNAKTILKQIGVGDYFDEVINNRLRGVSRMESLDIILEKSDRIYSQEDKEKLAEQKN